MNIHTWILSVQVLIYSYPFCHYKIKIKVVLKKKKINNSKIILFHDIKSKISLKQYLYTLQLIAVYLYIYINHASLLSDFWEWALLLFSKNIQSEFFIYWFRCFDWPREHNLYLKVLCRKGQTKVIYNI